MKTDVEVQDVDLENNEQAEAVEPEEAETAEAQDESEEIDLSDDSESEEDGVDWKAEALKYKAIAQRKAKKTSQPEAKEEKQSAPSSDEVRIARLEARGFLEEDEQNLIMRAAKSLGISDIEAAKDEIVLAKINHLREIKKTKAATPSSNKRSGAVEKDANYYIEKDIMPDTDDMREKVFAELHRRARSK